MRRGWVAASAARGGAPRRRAAAGTLAAAAAALALATSPAGAQVQAWTVGIPGQAADDNFGWSLAGAGDLNGDGIEDLVVTAIYNDEAGSAAGKAYVYFGGAAFDRSADVTMAGEAPDDHFGVSAAGAGDVNGDGYGDLIVGARFNDRAGSAAGAAFIYFGGSSMDGAADVVLTGEAADDWFGQSVAGAGDVNGDGYDDVVVGAPYNDRGANAAGAGVVYFGGAPMDAQADLIFAGQGNDEQVGWAVAGGGDVNGDLLADFATGSRLFPLSIAAGRALVFFGGRTPDAAPDVVLNGEFGGDWFGSAVALVGDMNGDGFDEIAVGAPFADPLVDGSPASAAGKAYVFFGGRPPSGAPALVAEGAHRDEQLGHALAAAGDVNADGLGDLIVGGHFHNPGGARAAGRALLFLGARALDDVPDLALVGEAADDQLGHAVGGADLNGDGLAEPLASAVYNDQVGSGAGKAYVSFLDPIRAQADADSVSWSASFPFEAFNVYRGEVAELRAGYGECFAAGVAGTRVADPEPLAAGGALFYLVSGLNDGIESPLGFTSSGAHRSAATPCR